MVQKSLRRVGYRLVPAARDAASIYKQVQRANVATVVDVGANRGDTVRGWRGMFPQAHIHAFEPLPAMQAHLKAVQALSPHHITIWPFAASDQDGEVRFQVHVDHPSSSSLLPRTEISAEMFEFTQVQKEILVKTCRLDAVLGPTSAAPVTGPVLLKLDVQGAELSVLRGATAILTQTEFIICEVNLAELYDGQCTFSDLLDFVQSHGFRFAGFIEQFSTPEGTAVYVDALFRRHIAP